METKVFECRDEGTHISVLATRFTRADSRSFWRAGYNGNEEYILLVNLSTMECQTDPNKWIERPRTMRVAHQYLLRDWDKLPNNSVLDVMVYLGYHLTPVESDFNEHS